VLERGAIPSMGGDVCVSDFGLPEIHEPDKIQPAPNHTALTFESF
jgi:hypothetical protein